MKTFFAALALAAVIGSPAFALSPKAASSVVSFGGQYVGQDPDAGIRSEMRRDWQSYTSGHN
jgi:hypothetical protein